MATPERYRGRIVYPELTAELLGLCNAFASQTRPFLLKNFSCFIVPAGSVAAGFAVYQNPGPFLKDIDFEIKWQRDFATLQGIYDEAGRLHLSPLFWNNTRIFLRMMIVPFLGENNIQMPIVETDFIYHRDESKVVPATFAIGINSPRPF